MTPAQERLRLAPAIGSAREARAWLTQRLLDTPDAVVDAATLLLSELVTNAVLHAGTDIDVGLDLVPGGVRVEVADRHPVHPSVKGYSADAATGRGLVLVDAMAEEWGVADAPPGKVVWFVVRDREGDDDAPADVPVVFDWNDVDDWPEVDPPPIELVPVHIRAMPLDVLRTAGEQYDALFREFRLILERDPTEATSVPGRLVALIDELGDRFANFTAEQDRELQEALARHDATIDLEYALPAEIGTVSLHYDELLDEADEYCRRGTHLLTLAPPPAAVAFRKWFLHEFSRQARGAAPTAWSDSEWAAS